jgi:SAM-dependent methyltransferase
MIFDYRDRTYPTFLKHGNACQLITPAALHFCQGRGLDVGCGKWPLPGAIPVELSHGGDAMALPDGTFDFVFSSHCLEHLVNPIAALKHWRTRLRPGGVLFLYLPHPDMEYWKPQHCTKHLHAWGPQDMAQIVSDLGFRDVIHSERDIAWSFAVAGFTDHG